MPVQGPLARLLSRLRYDAAGGEGPLDAAATTLRHAEIIRGKRPLRQVYEDFYSFFVRHSEGLPEGRRVELGSGAGFLKESIPDVSTSDVIALPGVDMAFSALDMPFEPGSVSAFYMVDVFHHLPDAERFLAEVVRCLRPGGRLMMIEPAGTPWARFVYRTFHHEAFDASAEEWKAPPGGRLSGANGALAWIVFRRDRGRFERLFPSLQIVHESCCCPFRYLLSGGLSARQMLPTIAFPAVRALECMLSPINGLLGMFMRVVLARK